MIWTLDAMRGDPRPLIPLQETFQIGTSGKPFPPVAVRMAET